MLQAAALRGSRPTAKYFTRRPNGRPPEVRVTQGPRQEIVIERTGDPDPADLQPFLDALRARAQAAAGGAP